MESTPDRIDVEQPEHAANQQRPSKRTPYKLSRADVLAWAQSLVSQQTQDQIRNDTGAPAHS